MSSWDYIDEVDILPKLPANFSELCDSKKWQERLEALEELCKLLEANERLSTKVSYADVVGKLQMMLAKDANIKIQATSAKCIGLFANGLRNNFSPFASPLLPVIFEKMKEKKAALRDPLVECSDRVAQTMPSLEPSQEDIVAALGKPNPQIKQQTLNFLARQLNLLPSPKQPKSLIKAVVPLFCKLSGDADADVREAAFGALGSVQRLIGEKNLKSLVGDLSSDDGKMKKIGEAAQVALGIFNDAQAKDPVVEEQPKASSGGTTTNTAGSSNSAKEVVNNEEPDPFDFLDPFDLLSKIPDNFDTNLESKKWTERRDALQEILDKMNANPKLDPKGNYGSLVDKLQKVLAKDSNINVCALAANCLRGIAHGLRAKFQPFALAVAPIIFEKFKEKKPTLRDPLIACIDSVAASTNLEALGEIVLSALGKPNPSIKTQTDMFLQRCFMKLNSQTMPKKTLKTLIPLLIKHSGDPDSEVRDASFSAMGAMMRAIGEKPAQMLLADIASDNLKMSKIKEYYQKALDVAGPAEVETKTESAQKSDAQPPAAEKAPKKVVGKKKPPPKEEDDQDDAEETAQDSGAEKSKKAVSPRENIENEPPVEKKSDLVLSENNEKVQRIRDEKALKVVKWNFPSPTDEHINQLQSQLGAQAKVSLMTLLFHSDFKNHVKAVDMLLKLAETAPNAIISNSDLLLKWCTLRFFETNPAALIKVLELCKVIVSLISETDTQMPTEELTSFLPYLLLKTGEAKENMRKSVREVLDILVSIVGPLKMAPMIIDALKSKNARQRAECLSVLESYVNNSGIVPLKSLSIEKTVAAFVADKDSHVRNAAINVLVACYLFEGDQMWKAAGRMPEKDKSLVEERIKRSGAVAASASVKTTPPKNGAKIIVPDQQGTVVRRPRSSSRIRYDEDNEIETEMNSTFVQSKETPRKNMEERPASRYALRDDFVSNATNRYLSHSIVKPIMQTPVAQPIHRTNSSSSISSIDTSDQIEKSINNISSSLQDVAQDALFQVTYVLNQPEQRHLVEKRAELLFRACAAQFDLIIEAYHERRPVEPILEACIQMLFILLGGVDQIITEPLQATAVTIKSIILAVLRCILTIGSDDSMIRIAKSLNRLAMRLIYRMELSNLLCGLILAMTEACRKFPDVQGLVTKLSSKWCDELEKRRTQLRASDIVNVFNEFYNLAIDEKRIDIDDENIVSLDSILERVIIQQGDVVMDAARRLSRPHMHLTSLINKVLMMMKSQNIAPIMPGTLEEVDESDDGVVVRSGINVLIDNMIRDSSMAVKHSAKLIELIDSDSEAKKVYLNFVKNNPFGALVENFVEKSRNSTLVCPRNPFAVQSVCETYNILANIGLNVDNSPQLETPSSALDNTFTMESDKADQTKNLAENGNRTFSKATTIKPPRKKTMTRDQFKSLQEKLGEMKTGVNQM